jgi:hypothetical protein
MPAPKGTRPPAAGKGRPKGARNKLTRDIREMIRAALNKAGGVSYLVKQAETNPTAFLTLVGKIIPAQINATVDKREIAELSRAELLGLLLSARDAATDRRERRASSSSLRGTASEEVSRLPHARESGGDQPETRLEYRVAQPSSGITCACHEQG